MPTNLSGRLAAATSIVALVVAMGGTGYAAAGKITGHDIKKNAITSAKVKNDSLTGTDINESSLGQVPSAANAGHAGAADTAVNATNAATAATVNGVKATKVFYQADPSGGVTVFSGSGLTITASCAAGNDIALTATTSVQNSSVYTGVTRDADPANPLEADLEGGGFDVGTTFDLLAAGNGNINLATFEFDSATGNVVTGTLAIDENGNRGCSATGILLSQ